MRSILIGIAALALAIPAFAQSNLQGTLWVGTSLMYETPYESGKSYTFAIGFAPIVIDNGSSNDTRFGLAAEGIFYQDKQPRGLAIVGRVGLVEGGLYFAPGVYYVNRPHDTRKISVRAGFLAPLGNIGDGDLLPWTLELAAGFRF